MTSAISGDGLKLALKIIKPTDSHELLVAATEINLLLNVDFLPQKINEKQQVINDYEAGKAIPNQQILSKLERQLGKCGRI